jgi:hypothetical protein
MIAIARPNRLLKIPPPLPGRLWVLKLRPPPPARAS